MSFSSCINCSSMVFRYEKYCDVCIKKLKVSQSHNWHKSSHSDIDVNKEINKDQQALIQSDKNLRLYQKHAKRTQST